MARIEGTLKMESFENAHLFPKHAPFPNFPERLVGIQITMRLNYLQINLSFRSEILNEFLLFAFTVISASSQFIHLYRTTWWFQDSYTKSTVVSQIYSKSCSKIKKIHTSLLEFLFNRLLSSCFYICDGW